MIKMTFKELKNLPQEKMQQAIKNITLYNMGRCERLINKQDLQDHTRFDLIEIIFDHDEVVTLDELKDLSYDELVDYILSLNKVVVSCI